MTDEQHINFYEYIKGMNTYSKDCCVRYSFEGMNNKHDCFGDVRLVIIPATAHFKKLNIIEYYNLLLKPKKNEISWEPRCVCKNKYPMECLKVFEQFGLKIIDNDTLRNPILDKYIRK